MKKTLAILLLALLLCASAAAELPTALQVIGSSAFEGDTALEGVITLPDEVTAVESRAFAATGVHALIVPEGCESIAADVLADGNAAYVTLQGMETKVSASTLADVPFIFAPSGSEAAEMDGFYAIEDLYVQDGLYYSLGEEEAIPLCAVSPMEGSVTLPKLVDGRPLRQLDIFSLNGMENASVCVPSYLTIPEGMTATTYDAMTLSAPVPSVTECTAGDAVTWTAEVSGAYGDVSYIWLFDTDGTVSSTITAEPTVTWFTTTDGLCIASVTAIDALGDRAEACSTGVTVGKPVPIYRALLIGNTYPDTEDELDGCDTDVYAMRSMLGGMPGTDYSVTVYTNQTSAQIQSAIGTTFADARPCDVSLFYFSGHGTSAGSLVGIGNSTVSVSTLRSWLDAVPGTKIVIIDACYSGNMIGKSEGSLNPAMFNSAFISGFSSFTKDNNLANNGYIVMTACSMTQKSVSLSDGTISFGAFTYSLCYGCGYDEWNQTSLSTLYADTDSNGAITLGEAYTLAVERVAWLETLLPEGMMEQSLQYYGDTSFILWSR